ncbi:YdaU family protein [Larkinella sp. GY13]|uniref:YdaU family protein n=1 Tax=Larkinella sp. GY13 TaxID=3453720 RepID=UPI003EEC28C6
MTAKSDRHWYPRYPGDYARKTAHLSLVQHGAYALLMDWYYSNAKPLPDDWVQMHRICKAIAPDEQQAVQTVVQEFFILKDVGWTNERADEEIGKKAKISDLRRDAQAERERIRLKNLASAGAKRGANAPSNAHTTTSTTTLDNTNVLSPPISPKARSEYSPEFEQFWQTYPNKTGKGNANKAYLNALKTHKELTHEFLLDRSGQFAAAHKAAGTPGQYIPHPATWLNGCRWEDDISGITKRQSAAPGAPNAWGSQFSALQSATAKILQEGAGGVQNGPPGLSERVLDTSDSLRLTQWRNPGSLAQLPDLSDTAGGQTIDHGPAGPADGGETVL